MPSGGEGTVLISNSGVIPSGLLAEGAMRFCPRRLDDGAGKGGPTKSTRRSNLLGDAQETQLIN